MIPEPNETEMQHWDAGRHFVAIKLYRGRIGAKYTHAECVQSLQLQSKSKHAGLHKAMKGKL